MASQECGKNMVDDSVAEEANFQSRDLEAANAILVYARDSVACSLEQFARLDAKGTSLIGFGGIIAVVNLFAMGELVKTFHLSPAWSAPGGLRLLFLLAYVVFGALLVTVFVLSLRVLQIRHYTGPVPISDVIEYYRAVQADPDSVHKLTKQLSLQLSCVDASLKTQIDSKVRYVTWATTCLFLALGSLVVATVLSAAVRLCGM